jgi:hypothetical protein
MPVAKAFVAFTLNMTPYKILDCTSGFFQQSDIGSEFWFSGGGHGKILYLCDVAGTRIYTRTSAYAAYDGAWDAGGIQSATLGNATAAGASIITATKLAYTVTRTAGAVFNSGDVGKPLFWSDGSITWIKTYTDPNTVDTLESGDKLSMCCVKDPTSRIITDFTTDEILMARIGDFFQAKHRLFEPLPDGVNRGAVLPGFLVVGKAGDSRYYYSQIPIGRAFRCGYYLPSDQYGDLADTLQSIEANPVVPNLRAISLLKSLAVVNTDVKDGLAP